MAKRYHNMNLINFHNKNIPYRYKPNDGKYYLLTTDQKTKIRQMIENEFKLREEKIKLNEEEL